MAAKLHERIPRPPYFTLMEKVNLKGGMPIERKPAMIPLLAPAKFASEMKQGLVLDGRDPEAFAGGHIPDSLGLWREGMGVFGGWVASETTSVYLVLDDEKQAEMAVTALARLGVDRVEGILAGGFDAWRDAGCPSRFPGRLPRRAFTVPSATTPSWTCATTSSSKTKDISPARAISTSATSTSTCRESNAA